MSFVSFPVYASAWGEKHLLQPVDAGDVSPDTPAHTCGLNGAHIKRQERHCNPEPAIRQAIAPPALPPATELLIRAIAGAGECPYVS
jgi:hypothetical protein